MSNIQTKEYLLPIQVRSIAPTVDIPTTIIRSLEPLISTIVPLLAFGIFNSGIGISVAEFSAISGTLFSDQAGSLSLQFSSDNVNWDGEVMVAYLANTKTPVSVNVTAPFFRVVYTNGAVAQTIFRLNLFGNL